MVVLYAASVAVHLALSWRMAGPVIQDDEGAYLGTANLLVHGTGLLFRQSPFQPAYGLLLWPVGRLTSDPVVLYRAALVLNSLALASLVVVAYWLTGWLMDRAATGKRLAVAAVVAAYPPFLAYSNVVLEASVFIPLCLLVAVLVARGAEQPRWQRWFAAGLVAGASFAVHALGGVVVAAVLIVAIAARRPLHERLPAVVGSLAGIQVSAVPTVLLLHRVIAFDQHQVAALGRAAPAVVSRSQAIGGLYGTNSTVPGHVHLLVAEMAGQGWYLATATLGLAAVGLVVGARACWDLMIRRSQRPADFVAAFAAVLAGLGLFLSADRFIDSAGHAFQADQLIYGRYNEHLLAPLLVVAVATLAQPSRWRAVAGRVVAAAAVIGGSGALLASARSAASLRAPIVFLNVMGLQPLLHTLGRIDVAAVSLAAVAAAAVVLVLARSVGVVALAPVLVAAGLASASYSASTMVADSRLRAQERVVIHALDLVDRVAGRQRCLGYDVAIGSEWATANDQTFRPVTEFRPFAPARRQRPCSELVLTARLDLDALYPGARLMALEDYTPSYLWVLPGPVLDRLAARGMVLPPRFPAALPPAAYRSHLALLAAAPVTAGRERAVRVRLAVTNAGAGSPWPSRRAFTAGDGWVSLVVEWTAAGAPPPPAAALFAHATREQLQRELWPGETEVDLVTIPARQDGRALPPGSYRLSIGLVQDGISYFADHGDAPLLLDVVVR